MASSSGLPPTLEETREECFARITGSFSAARPYELKKEKKKKRKKRKKRKNAPGTLWMLAISRRETKIKQALPDFTVFSRPREIPRATSPFSNPSLCVFPPLLSIPSSFSVPRRALTRLWINVNFLIE